jgi:hypothetical protein
MDAAVSKNNGYSANVRMQLQVNGSILPIGQLGPDFIILDKPAAYPPGRAEIRLSIDDWVTQWEIELPHGISGEEVMTRFVRRES